MKVYFKWGPVMATLAEREEIEARITEDLRSSHIVTLQEDTIVNVSFFPDEPRDFKIFGVAKDSAGKPLFKLMLSGMEYPLSIDYCSLLVDGHVD
jgi:hypothetical protein